MSHVHTYVLIGDPKPGIPEEDLTIPITPEFDTEPIGWLHPMNSRKIPGPKVAECSMWMGTTNFCAPAAVWRSVCEWPGWVRNTPGQARLDRLCLMYSSHDEGTEWAVITENAELRCRR